MPSLRAPIAPIAAPTLAPRGHTALLVALIVTVASLGVALSRYVVATPPSTEGSDRLASVYAPMFVVNVAMVLYAVRIGRGEWAEGWLIGTWPRTVKDAARDLAIAVALFAVIETAEWSWTVATASGLAADASRASSSVAPTTATEHFVWLALAVVIGVCEEIVYRGYLQMQLGAFLRSPARGVLAQAALFGLAHLDQGASSAARVAIYAIAFGAIAQWRKSLLPGIVCHVGIDLFAGWGHS